jgi:hypothetical protein
MTKQQAIKAYPDDGAVMWEGMREVLKYRNEPYYPKMRRLYKIFAQHIQKKNGRKPSP